MPRIRALVFCLLALSSETKKGKRQQGRLPGKESIKAVKYYLWKGNCALWQWVQSIQKPLIASSDLMRFYVGLLEMCFSAWRFLFSSFLHSFRTEEVTSENRKLLQSETMMQNLKQKSFLSGLKHADWFSSTFSFITPDLRSGRKMPLTTSTRNATQHFSKQHRRSNLLPESCSSKTCRLTTFCLPTLHLVIPSATSPSHSLLN